MCMNYFFFTAEKSRRYDVGCSLINKIFVFIGHSFRRKKCTISNLHNYRRRKNFAKTIVHIFKKSQHDVYRCVLNIKSRARKTIHIYILIPILYCNVAHIILKYFETRKNNRSWRCATRQRRRLKHKPINYIVHDAMYGALMAFSDVPYL